jgi:hypothetical protein
MAVQEKLKTHKKFQNFTLRYEYHGIKMCDATKKNATFCTSKREKNILLM